MPGTNPRSRTTLPLLIGFFDMAGFTRVAQALDDQVLAEVVDIVYTAIGEAVATSGGRVLKYIGDGALATWPPEQADAAVASAIGLRRYIGERLQSYGVHSEPVIRFHFGPVVAGKFGPVGAEVDDITGKHVFIAARLPARTLSVSADAFRRLSPELRKQLKKHSEPVVYIPVDDPRP